MTEYYLAVDIGASSGRHILGSVAEGRIQLEEVYRFENGMKEKNGHLCWDSEYLFEQIVTGMRKCKEIGKIPVTMGIDTWGVDFVLVDKDGNKIGDSVGYRDSRTEHIKESVNQIVSSKELYGRTGIQDQPYNTINQLMALKAEKPEELEAAESMLMTPDYFNFCLTGIKKQEYTIATTGQLIDLGSDDWDYDLIAQLGLPKKIFLPISQPGTVVGSLKEEIREKVGFDCQVLMVASHDTASAVMSVPSLDDNSLYISSGTWSLMGIESKESNCSNESREAGFTNEGGYNFRYRYLKNIMGLWMIQSIKKEIGQGKSFGEICEEASKMKIASVVDCNDSVFLAPPSMVTAVQDYCRNTKQQVPVTLPEMAAVIYNSLAKCYGKTKRQIEELYNVVFDRIYIIGGGSQADYLNRLTAKYAKCDVYAGPTEATAIGNLLAQMIYRKTFLRLEDARKCVMESFDVKKYEHCN